MTIQSVASVDSSLLALRELAAHATLGSLSVTTMKACEVTVLTDIDQFDVAVVGPRSFVIGIVVATGPQPSFNRYVPLIPVLKARAANEPLGCHGSMPCGYDGTADARDLRDGRRSPGRWRARWETPRRSAGR